MSKFKVGDRVKLVSMKGESPWYKEYLNKTFTIERINDRYVEVKEITKDPLMPYLKNLELVNKKYTYEDLKKSPVGTKITFEDGTVFVQTYKGEFENELTLVPDKVTNLKNLRDLYYGKIIKIEEPEYNTVYETKKKEILDEGEKRYLSNFIRPFRDKVEWIEKVKTYDPDMEYIQILINTDEEINLPSFEVGEMYKGMKANQRYELEELGL